MTAPYALRPWRQLSIPFRSESRLIMTFSGMCLSWEPDEIFIYHKGLHRYRLGDTSLTTLSPSSTHDQKPPCPLENIIGMCPFSATEKTYLIWSICWCKNKKPTGPQMRRNLCISNLRQDGTIAAASSGNWTCIDVQIIGQEKIDANATMLMLVPYDLLAITYDEYIYVLDLIRGTVRNKVNMQRGKFCKIRNLIVGSATTLVDGGVFVDDQYDRSLCLYQIGELMHIPRKNVPCVPLQRWHYFIPRTLRFYCPWVKRELVLCPIHENKREDNILFAVCGTSSVYHVSSARTEIRHGPCFTVPDRAQDMLLDRRGRLWCLSHTETKHIVCTYPERHTLTVAVTDT